MIFYLSCRFAMLELGSYPSFYEIGVLRAKGIDFEAMLDENIIPELDIPEVIEKEFKNMATDADSLDTLINNILIGPKSPQIETTEPLSAQSLICPPESSPVTYLDLSLKESIAKELLLAQSENHIFQSLNCSVDQSNNTGTTASFLSPSQNSKNPFLQNFNGSENSSTIDYKTKENSYRSPLHTSKNPFLNNVQPPDDDIKKCNVLHSEKTAGPQTTNFSSVKNGEQLQNTHQLMNQQQYLHQKELQKNQLVQQCNHQQQHHIFQQKYSAMQPSKELQLQIPYEQSFAPQTTNQAQFYRQQPLTQMAGHPIVSSYPLQQHYQPHHGKQMPYAQFQLQPQLRQQSTLQQQPTLHQQQPQILQQLHRYQYEYLSNHQPKLVSDQNIAPPQNMPMFPGSKGMYSAALRTCINHLQNQYNRTNQRNISHK